MSKTLTVIFFFIIYGGLLHAQQPASAKTTENKDSKPITNEDLNEKLEKILKQIDENNINLNDLKGELKIQNSDFKEQINALDTKVHLAINAKRLIQDEDSKSVVPPKKSIPLYKFALPWAWESKPSEKNYIQSLIWTGFLIHTGYSYFSYLDKLDRYNNDMTGALIFTQESQSNIQGITFLSYMKYNDLRDQIEDARKQYQTASLLFLGAWVGFAIWNKTQFYPNQDWSWTFNMRPDRNPIDQKAVGTAYDFGFMIRF